MDVQTPLLQLARGRALAATGEGRRIRQQARVSLRELAPAIGVDPATLARWETGETTPRADAARRWAVALAVLAESVE